MLNLFFLALGHDFAHLHVAECFFKPVYKNQLLYKPPNSECHFLNCVNVFILYPPYSRKNT